MSSTRSDVSIPTLVTARTASATAKPSNASPSISTSTMVPPSHVEVDDPLDHQRAHDHHSHGEGQQRLSGRGREKRVQVARVDPRDDQHEDEGEERDDPA